ncbi:MAG: aldehyde dehydrogenase family protein, partial [Clostridiaceae bacterium]
MSIQRLKPYINGAFVESKTAKYMPVYDPSTGETIAETPCCTVDEVNAAVAAAKAAFPAWSDTPCAKRVEVLYRFRDLLTSHMDELTHILCRENGKNWDEARGDLLKVKEPVEVAIGAPSMLMGESLMNVTSGFDSTLYREPLGVFV